MEKGCESGTSPAAYPTSFARSHTSTAFAFHIHPLTYKMPLFQDKSRTQEQTHHFANRCTKVANTNNEFHSKLHHFSIS